MTEYCTEAVVLGIRGQGERDRVVDLYTKDLGRVEARVVGGRKLNSKLSPHLDLGGRVLARLVFKNQFTVTDVLQEAPMVLQDGVRKSSAPVFLKILYLLKKTTPLCLPDFNIWHRLAECAMRSGGSAEVKIFLKMLGYDARLSECDNCGSVKTTAFHFERQVFVCNGCARKIAPGELLSLEL